MKNLGKKNEEKGKRKNRRYILPPKRFLKQKTKPSLTAEQHWLKTKANPTPASAFLSSCLSPDLQRQREPTHTSYSVGREPVTSY